MNVPQEEMDDGLTAAQSQCISHPGLALPSRRDGKAIVAYVRAMPSASLRLITADRPAHHPRSQPHGYGEGR